MDKDIFYLRLTREDVLSIRDSLLETKREGLVDWITEMAIEQDHDKESGHIIPNLEQSIHDDYT